MFPLQVGYIVGLGDRHSMNILIDQATAEVVHIDLGVAFEQGLMLKTPERVCVLMNTRFPCKFISEISKHNIIQEAVCCCKPNNTLKFSLKFSFFFPGCLWQVPFRLTRDVIDGMGITGVEGVFRRCCEETLSVMRTNKEALLTIIEVLPMTNIFGNSSSFCLIFERTDCN